MKIQRYNFSSITDDEFATEDNDGEWVKWEDVKNYINMAQCEYVNEICDNCESRKCMEDNDENSTE